MPAIYRAELAIRISPLVPDPDAIVFQVRDVRVAGDEPEKLVDDRLQMQLLGGETGEAVRKIETHLVAEDGQGSRAGAVGPLGAVVEDVLDQVEILSHWTLSQTGSLVRVREG